MEFLLAFIYLISVCIGMNNDKIAAPALSGQLSPALNNIPPVLQDLALSNSAPLSLTMPMMVNRLNSDEPDSIATSGHGTMATVPSFISVKTTNTRANTQHTSKTVNDAKSVSFTDTDRGKSIIPESARIIATSSNHQNKKDETTTGSIDNPILPPKSRTISLIASPNPARSLSNTGWNARLTTEKTMIIDDQFVGAVDQNINTETTMERIGMKRVMDGGRTPPSPSSIPHAQSSSMNTVVIEQIMGAPKTERIITVERETQTTPKVDNDGKDNVEKSGWSCAFCTFNCPISCVK